MSTVMADQTKKRLDVAVAVVFNDRGQVLWGSRPSGKPYAGYWEFPGGKVEPDETVWQALVRELREELGIEALQGAPWFVIEHDYEHANVRLHLYRVNRFRGDPQALENQAFKWDTLMPSSLGPILPATEPILPRMALPSVMAITRFSEFEIGQALSRLSDCASQQLNRRVLVQFREPDLEGSQLAIAWQAVRNFCRTNEYPLVINSATALNLLQCGVPLSLSQTQPEMIQVSNRLAGFEASAAKEIFPMLHLTEAHLLSRPPELAGFNVAGASVHCHESIQSAFSQGLDYCVLGSVLATPSHPGQPGIGWDKFETIKGFNPLPVYAVGGMTQDLLDKAQSHGAHGIAMIRAY